MKRARFCLFHESSNEIAYFMKQANALPVSGNKQILIARFMKQAESNLTVGCPSIPMNLIWIIYHIISQISSLRTQNAHLPDRELCSNNYIRGSYQWSTFSLSCFCKLVWGDRHCCKDFQLLNRSIVWSSTCLDIGISHTLVRFQWEVIVQRF